MRLSHLHLLRLRHIFPLAAPFAASVANAAILAANGATRWLQDGRHNEGAADEAGTNEQDVSSSKRPAVAVELSLAYLSSTWLRRGSVVHRPIFACDVYRRLGL